MNGFFLTGTGTGIGKTWFAAFLVRSLKEQGLTVRYIKPVATGYPEDDDAAFVAQLSYPAPLTMMTSAFAMAAMSALVGS